MGALEGCRTVKFDSCNNFSSPVYTLLVIVMQYVPFQMKRRCYNYYAKATKMKSLALYTHSCNSAHSAHSAHSAQGCPNRFFKPRFLMFLKTFKNLKISN